MEELLHPKIPSTNRQRLRNTNHPHTHTACKLLFEFNLSFCPEESIEVNMEYGPILGMGDEGHLPWCRCFCADISEHIVFDPLPEHL